MVSCTAQTRAAHPRDMTCPHVGPHDSIAQLFACPACWLEVSKPSTWLSRQPHSSTEGGQPPHPPARPSRRRAPPSLQTTYSDLQ
jgi:hypothetical protein